MAHTYDITHKNWHVFCFFFSQLNLYSFLIGNKNKIYVKIPWKNILGKLILFFFFWEWWEKLILKAPICFDH